MSPVLTTSNEYTFYFLFIPYSYLYIWKYCSYFPKKKNCYVNIRTSIEFSRLTHLHVSEYCKLMPINETDFVLRLVCDTTTHRRKSFKKIIASNFVLRLYSYFDSQKWSRKRLESTWTIIIEKFYKDLEKSRSSIYTCIYLNILIDVSLSKIKISHHLIIYTRPRHMHVVKRDCVNFITGVYIFYDYRILKWWTS